MMNSEAMGFAVDILNFLAVAFVVVVGILVAIAAVLFVIDRLQTHDAIRRNYPVIGRFRHIFSTLGEFFRQYFFAMDREELPFNRAQREWVKRAGEGKGNTVALWVHPEHERRGNTDLRERGLPPSRRSICQLGAPGDRRGDPPSI